MDTESIEEEVGNKLGMGRVHNKQGIASVILDGSWVAWLSKDWRSCIFINIITRYVFNRYFFLKGAHQGVVAELCLPKSLTRMREPP